MNVREIRPAAGDILANSRTGAVPRRLFHELDLARPASQERLDEEQQLRLKTTNQRRINERRHEELARPINQEALEEEQRLSAHIANQRRINELRCELRELELAGEAFNVQPIAAGTPVNEPHDVQRAAPANNAIIDIASHEVVRPQYRIQLEEVRSQVLPFSGDDSISVEQWLTGYSNAMASYGAAPSDFLRIGRMMMAGSAAVWSRGQIFLNWTEFSAALRTEFHREISMADIYSRLRSRVYRRPEPMHTYVIEMQAIARQGPMAVSENELIQHIVVGFRDQTIDIAELLGCTKMDEFKNSLANYKARKDLRAKAEWKAKAPLPKQMAGPQMKKPPPGGWPERSADALKCFNCNEMGHLANTCTKPKIERNTCFVCRQIDHMARDCPRRQVGFVATPAEAYSTPMEAQNWYEEVMENGENEPLNINEEVRINFDPNVGNSFIDVVCLLDTGSPVSFVRQSVVPGQHMLSRRLHASKYRGLGNSKIFSFGTILCKLTLRSQTHMITCFILPDHILPSDLLLGRDYLQMCRIRLCMLHPRTTILNKQRPRPFLQYIAQTEPQFLLNDNKNFAHPAHNMKETILMCFNSNAIPSDIIDRQQTSTANLLAQMESINRVSNICRQSFVAACRSNLHGRIQKIENSDDHKTTIVGGRSVDGELARCGGKIHIGNKSNSVGEIPNEQKEGSASNFPVSPMTNIKQNKRRPKLLPLNKEWLLAGRTEESIPSLSYVYNVNGLDELWDEHIE